MNSLPVLRLLLLQEEWKYGLKLDPNISNIMLQPSGTTLYRIDNEDELLDHGMAEYGPVDFSTKTVLVAYNALVGSIKCLLSACGCQEYLAKIPGSVMILPICI